MKRMGWLIVAVMVAGGAARGANSYHVHPDGEDGANDGLSWETAFQTIGYAVGQATTPGDEVVVSNGTYVLSDQISVLEGITVRGLNGPGVTIVDANFVTRGFLISNAAAVVEGFTIRHGNAPPEDMPAGHVNRRVGSGVRLYAGQLHNCIIRNNTGDPLDPRRGGDGAGIYIDADGVVSNCVVMNNIGVYGGGIGNWFHAGGARVVDCVISNNVGWGGGVNLKYSTIERCVIADNSAALSVDYLHSASGIRQYGGTNRNCLIVGNTHGEAYGGIRLTDGGLLEHATVVDNQTGSATLGAGIDAAAGTTVHNTISHGNLGPVPDVFGGAVSFSRMFPLVAGAGNREDEPAFVFPAARDFRLRPTSPCIDTGTNLTWTADASDLSGRARLEGARPDMGAYEFPQGALSVAFTADVTEALLPLHATFTAAVEGASDGLYYRWSFEDGGATVDLEGAGLDEVFNTYTNLGVYTVALAVSNALGDVAVYVLPESLIVHPPALYVSLDGGDAPPYDTWGNAATNIQVAVDAAFAGAEVIVSNGLYLLTEQIQITKGITLRGLHGAEATIVDANYVTRGLLVSNAAARVDGFTFRHGKAPQENMPMGHTNRRVGSGVRLYAGWLVNSIVRDNTGDPLDWMRGGDGAGVFFHPGAVVSNCVITGNIGVYGGGIGNNLANWSENGGVIADCVIAENTGWAAVNVRYATLERCIIRDNTGIGSGTHNAGGLRQYGGTNRSCLIVGNTALDATGGGAVLTDGAWMENATVARNVAGTAGTGESFRSSGVRADADDLSQIRNSIIWGNAYTIHGKDLLVFSTTQVDYSCHPVIAGGNNINTDPQFASPDADNFRLRSHSPCLDSGLNQDGMADARDVLGGPRVLNGTVDMGAIEGAVPPEGFLMRIR